jgi:hypothetical protein
MSGEESCAAKAVEDAIRMYGPKAPLTIARAVIRAIDIYRSQNASPVQAQNLEFKFPAVVRIASAQDEHVDRA